MIRLDAGEGGALELTRRRPLRELDLVPWWGEALGGLCPSGELRPLESVPLQT